MDKHQNYADYADSMNNARRKKGQEKLRTVALHFQSTLLRLPALKQELDAMLESTEALDYEELLKRVEPVLQQAGDWLWDVDNLPRDLADDAEMKKFTADVCARLALANAARLIPSFYSFQQKVMGDRENAKREKAEAKRRAEKESRQAAEKKAQSEKLRSVALHYEAALQRLPTLKQELDAMLQSTEVLDYEELVKRVEPALQQADAWLLKIDLLPFEIANEFNIKETITKFSEIMRLSTVNHLIEHFDQELTKEDNPEYCYQKFCSYFEKQEDFTSTRFFSRKDTDFEKILKNIDKPNYLKYLEKAANLGHLDAQFNLGNFFWSGCVVGLASNNDELKKHSELQCAYWLEKAAKQGHIDAQCRLGFASYMGISGIPHNLDKAIYWLDKASNQGNENAQHWLGSCFADVGNSEKAIYWLEQCAFRGEISSQMVLGKRYAEGNGLPQNSEKAVFWLEKAASHPIDEDVLSSQRASQLTFQYSLGERYADGLGILKNPERACYWLEKAADKLFNDAQSKLGKRYAQGDGIHQDTEKAIFWLEKSLGGDDYPRGNYELGIIYAEDGILQDLEKALYWLEKAANESTMFAIDLAKLFIDGFGIIPHNAEKAVSWFERAANQNFGIYLLAKRYADGDGIAMDFKRAKYWMQKAAEQGDKKAIEWLIENQ
jgi:TPR repeat protein